MAPRTKPSIKKGPSVRLHFKGGKTGNGSCSSRGNNQAPSKNVRNGHKIDRIDRSSQSEGSATETEGLKSGTTDDDDADCSDEADDDEETDVDPERSAPSRSFRVSKRRVSFASGYGDANEQSPGDARGRRTGRPKKGVLASPFSLPKKKKSTSSGNSDPDSKIRDYAGMDVQGCRGELWGTSSDKEEALSHSDARIEEELSTRDFLGDIVEQSGGSLEEDDYTGVDQIEADEENDRDLKILEEEYIIDSEEQGKVAQRSSPSSDSDCHDTEREGHLPCDALLYGQGADDVLGFPSEAAFVLESLGHNRKNSNNTSKRVRFQDELYDSDSTTMSSEQDSVIFPDIFELKEREDQATQNSAFEGTNALTEALFGSDSDSYWDLYADGVYRDALEDDLLDSDEEEDSEAGSSGYETDIGDTTDEEDPPPHVHNPIIRLQRQPSTSSSETTPTPPQSARSDGPASQRKGPVLGQFVVDPSKAILVLDQNRPKILPPQAPPAHTDTTNGGISAPADPASILPHEYVYSMESDPLKFFPSRTRLMLDSMYGTPNGDVLGPSEAFYPFFSVDLDGNVIQPDCDLYEDDDDEDAMDIRDFIDFGESEESDSGVDQRLAEETEFTESSMAATDLDSSMTFTPKGDRNPRPIKSNGNRYHFANGGATASYRNPYGPRPIAREPYYPAFRSTIHNAVQIGRAAAVEEPITPLRRKRSATFAALGSPVAKKMKQTHHRRSLSDIAH